MAGPYREPDLTTSGKSSVYDEHTFKLRVLFGSSAITSYRSKDVTIARNGAGNYTLQLPKTYEELVDFKGSLILHAAGQHLFFSVKTETLSTDGTCVVEARTAAGTATDPASGDKATLTISASSNPLNTKFTG
jgi:hypothetical protein